MFKSNTNFLTFNEIHWAINDEICFHQQIEHNTFEIWDLRFDIWDLIFGHLFKLASLYLDLMDVYME